MTRTDRHRIVALAADLERNVRDVTLPRSRRLLRFARIIRDALTDWAEEDAQAAEDAEDAQPIAAFYKAHPHTGKRRKWTEGS